MRVLILGASGLCGSYIGKYLAKRKYSVTGTYQRTGKADHGNLEMLPWSLEDTEGLKRMLQSQAPDIVISCLRGEYGRQLKAHEIAAEYIKQERQRRLFYFSSANVFDGAKEAAHFEGDPPRAKTEYGIFKLKCEEMLRERIGDQAAIFRLPQVWACPCPRWSELERQIIQGEPIPLYENLFLNVATTEQIARYTEYSLKRDLTGIFHIGTYDVWEHARFYTRLAKEMGAENARFCRFQASSAPEYQAVVSEREDLPEGLKWGTGQAIEFLTANEGRKRKKEFFCRTKIGDGSK